MSHFCKAPDTRMTRITEAKMISYADKLYIVLPMSRDPHDPDGHISVTKHLLKFLFEKL